MVGLTPKGQYRQLTSVSELKYSDRREHKMKLKEGVIMAGIQPVMRKALKEADRIWTQFGEELVITSALDGEHSAGSLHYYGYALDLRTRYFSEYERARIFEHLCNSIGNVYTVVHHTTHIHIQYNGRIDGLT